MGVRPGICSHPRTLLNFTMACLSRKMELLKLPVELACESVNIDVAPCWVVLDRQMKQHRRRALWKSSWLLHRPQFSQFDQLQVEDASDFGSLLQMHVNMFKELLGRVGPHIEKQNTFWREALSPGLRLAVTLQYLSTGASYKTLQYCIKVAHSTISLILPETYEAIIAEYQDEKVMSCPKMPAQWKEVASLFSHKWNFPLVVGALDGKHVAIRCPLNGGSNYYNYNGFHSIVFMALVYADYKFLYCDVGAIGCSSDGGLFSATPLRKSLEDNTVGLPSPEPLPGGSRTVSYCLLGEDTFPLRDWMMKPFPHRNMTRPEPIFNYQLSRARRVIVNVFEIMASRELSRLCLDVAISTTLCRFITLLNLLPSWMKRTLTLIYSPLRRGSL